MAGSLWQAAGVVAAAVAVALLPSRAEAGILWARQPVARASILRPRNVTNPETVVLADCLDNANVISSQMAYFPGPPNEFPQDVAIVATNPREAALWVNSETSARFTATNTLFVATIGPKVAQGEYAGRGNNGYGNFSCWEQYTPKLYKYGDTVCSQVYLCDKRAPPPQIGVINPTSSVGAPASSDGAQPGSSGASGGLSEGALIGIVVSIVGVAAILAGVGVVVWFKRRLRRKEQGEADESSSSHRSCCGLFGGRRGQRGDPPQANSTELPEGHGRNEMPGGDAAQNMAGGRARPSAIELADTTDKYELDAGRDGIVWSDVKKEDMFEGGETKWAKEKGGEQPEPMELPLVSPLSPDPETSKNRPDDGEEVRSDGKNR